VHYTLLPQPKTRIDRKVDVKPRPDNDGHQVTAFRMGGIPLTPIFLTQNIVNRPPKKEKEEIVKRNCQNGKVLMANAAFAFGKTGYQAAVRKPANSFFANNKTMEHQANDLLPLL